MKKLREARKESWLLEIIPDEVSMSLTEASPSSSLEFRSSSVKQRNPMCLHWYYTVKSLCISYQGKG